MSINYVSQEGFDSLKEQIAHLEKVERKRISGQIADARDKGDLSENAEYDAAKEAQGLLEMKISKLKNTLATSRVINPADLDLSKVNIQTKVRLLNKKFNKEVIYYIVGESEANLREGKISVKSPIGEGLMGKKIGEIAEIQVPAGTIQFEILEVSLP
ncbi:transcription elongation factor GreA [Bacteroidia bacterium]|jgi:transcription elongation factor GreA|nr:transcription elongation factor GreA [Bacteroidia bacterium]MDB4173451.1 transcription elongation factor GreA [Bacteroidia bacterium]